MHSSSIKATASWIITFKFSTDRGTFLAATEISGVKCVSLFLWLLLWLPSLPVPWHTNMSIFTIFAAPENSFDTVCASNFWPIWSPASPIKFKSPDWQTHIWLIILPRLKTRRGLISGKCLVGILPPNQDDDPKKVGGKFFVRILLPEAVMYKTGGGSPPRRTNNPIFPSSTIFSYPCLHPPSPFLHRHPSFGNFHSAPAFSRPNPWKYKMPALASLFHRNMVHLKRNTRKLNSDDRVGLLLRNSTEKMTKTVIVMF